MVDGRVGHVPWFLPMVDGCVGHFGPGVEEVHPLDEVAHPEAQGLAGLVGILLQIDKERHIDPVNLSRGLEAHFCQGELPWQEMPFFSCKNSDKPEN